VASVYLVAAWLVIQVVTTVSPVLSFPRWLTTAVVIVALVGFPVAVVVAWAFDLTAQGVEVTDSARLIRAPWLRYAMAMLVITIVVTSGFALWLRVRPARVSASVTPTIAVFPFAVQGGASVEYLREGIVNLLSTSLNGVGTMRSVDPTTLLNSLTESQRLGVDREAAARVAREVGATSYIVGEISGDPSGQLVLTATQYSLNDPKAPPATAAVRGSAEEILDKIDELAGLLLTGQMRDAGSRLSRIAALTSRELPALKAYLQGEAEYREARWPTAMSFFQRAEEEDSTFALASYRLAVAADWASKFDIARPAALRAMRHSERLSEHDRGLLRAFNAALNGRADEAEAAYRQITQQYPDDVEAWYRYGEVLYHYNNIRGRSIVEAKPMLERALKGVPDAEPMLLHLLELALMSRDFTAFDSLTKRIDQTKPAAFRRIAVRDYLVADQGKRRELDKLISTAADGDVLVVAMNLAQFGRDFENAERVMRFLTDSRRPLHVRATGYAHIAQYKIARGQWLAAKAELNQLQALHRPSGLEYRALYAALPFLRVPRPEILALRSELELWRADQEPPLKSHPAYLGGHDQIHPILRDYLLGLLSVRLGDLPAAEAAAKRLISRPDTTARALASRLGAGVQAFVATSRNERQRALQILERAQVNSDFDYAANSPFWSSAFERWLRAEMLRFAGREREAIGWFIALPEGRNELFLKPMSVLGTGAAYQKLGDGSGAEAAFKEFESLWRSADPSLQDWVDYARKQTR
jgi:hypothetical protein